MTITDDKEFKLALASLPVERQRQIAVAFCGGSWTSPTMRG